MPLNPLEIGVAPSVTRVTDAPSWDSGRYLSFSGRSYTYKDQVNMTNMDVARNGGLITAAKIAGTLLMKAPGAVGIAGIGAAVLGYGYDTYKLQSNLRANRNNNEFWTKYESDVTEVARQSGMEKQLGAFAIKSNLVSGYSMPSEVGDYTGNLGGFLGELTKYGAMFVAGGQAGFIYGGAISNAANEYNEQMGMGDTKYNATRAAFATGIASGLTGKLFLDLMPRMMTRASGKMIDAWVSSGATPATTPFIATPTANFLARGGEFAGWGMTDPAIDTMIRKGLGDDKADYDLNGWAAVGMFAMGGIASGALKGKGYSDIMKLIADKKKALGTVADATGESVVAAEEAIGEEFAGLPNYGDKATFEATKRARFGATGAVEPYAETQGAGNFFVIDDALEQDFYNRAILKDHGVSAKRSTPEAIESVGGIENTLKLAIKDPVEIEAIKEELATANRLIKQAQDYRKASVEFTTARTGGKVTDTFIPDAEGVARKVRIVDAKKPWEMTAEEIGLTKDFYIKKLGKEDIAQAMPDGRIALDRDNFFGHDVKTRKEIIEHERAHFIEEKIRSEDKAKYFDVPSVMNYRGRNINEKLANMIQDNKIVPEVLADYPNLKSNVPDHIKKSVGLGSAAIVSGLIYTNLGNDQWDVSELSWITPYTSQMLAEEAVEHYRLSLDKGKSLQLAMNHLPDNYALNPENYKMVYDRFMKLTGSYN